MPFKSNNPDEAFLITAADSNEASLIESLLQAYHIPALRKYRGPGDYIQLYWGMTVLGIDLFVPTASLTEARDILGDSSVQNEVEAEDTETLDSQRQYEQDIKTRNWIVLAIYFFSGFGFIAMFFYGIYKFFNKQSYHQS